MATDSIPTLRWGIIGTGLISSWFVADLTIDRANKKANHFIQAIGSSSTKKGQAFVEKYLPGKSPTVYGSYKELYQDLNVDIVYIGTPHAFHKQNCLDAIRNGKNVLCEKAFALNESQAKEVFDEAERKDAFVMEARWTRSFSLGYFQRVFCDFSMPMDIASLPSTSCLKNPAVGAGSLLDIGIYSITWAILALESERHLEKPRVISLRTFSDETDVANSVILSYPNGKQGVATCSTFTKTLSSFCRIEGSEDTVTVDGVAASVPASFTVTQANREPKQYEFERPSKGFYWEADAVALDIAAGKKQSDAMPWAETLRILSLLDEPKRRRITEAIKYTYIT